MVVASLLAVLQATVSFSAPAAPASRLLPALGKAVGIRIEVGPSLAREVLLVKARDVSLSDLMQRIAQSTHGDWERKDDVYRLSLSGAIALRQRSVEAIAKGERLLTPAREQLKRELDSPKPWAARVAVITAASQIPAETLGGFGYKARVVFSTHPTAMQRPMPVGLLNGIKLNTLTKQPSLIPGQYEQPAPGPIATVMLAVNMSADDRGFWATLATANAAGDFIGCVGFNSWAQTEPLPRAGAAPYLPKPTASISLSKKGKALAQTLVSVDMSQQGYGAGESEGGAVAGGFAYSDGELGKGSTAADRPELRQPETNDPLSLVVGPLVEKFSAVQGVNVVALLPDSSFAGAAIEAARGSVTAKEFVDDAWKTMDLDIAVDDAWAIVQPKRPSTARATRLDRAALGTALRALAQDGGLSLDAQAAYAVAQPLMLNSDTFDATLFATLDSGFGARMATSCAGDERRTLRLYRAMGGSLPKEPKTFLQLPPAAKTALTDLVFNSMFGPAREVRWQYNGVSHLVTVASTGNDLRDTLNEERTVYWGRGIPAEATFTIQDILTTPYFGLAPSGLRLRMEGGGSSTSFGRDANGRITSATSLPHLDQYAQGSVRELKFELTSSPGLSFRRSLESESVPANARQVSFRDLPESVRKRILDSDEAMRNGLQEFLKGEKNGQP